MSESSRVDGGSDIESLQQAFLSLRNLVQAVVIVMIVLSASLNVFLLRQVTLVRKEIQTRETYISAYLEGGYPKLDTFLDRLQRFAEDNASLQPVLQRHYPERVSTNANETLDRKGSE